jgi:hypothetical protein
LFASSSSTGAKPLPWALTRSTYRPGGVLNRAEIQPGGKAYVSVLGEESACDDYHESNVSEAVPYLPKRLKRLVGASGLT